MTCIYYRLNLELSNADENFASFYADVDNEQHGGKYDAIYELPVLMSTNTQLTQESGERGIQFTKSSDIECVIDPFINISPKDGDLLYFNLSLNNHGIYRVHNIDYSSTLHRPYSKLSLQLVPTLDVDKMESRIVNKLGFIDNYHNIFNRGDALMITELQKSIDKYIQYFNSIYNSTIDAHVDNEKRVFLDFEKAFNELINRNNAHLMKASINRSYLADNLLSYYDESNIFTAMLNVMPDKNESIINYDYINKTLFTSRISRLDKTRRRSINNRIAIYRMINPDKESDAKLVSNNDSSLKDLELPLEAINEWNTILNDPNFLKNVKDQLSTFIEKSLVVKPSNMLYNATRFAQAFYIIDTIVNTSMKNSKFNLDNFFRMKEV